MRLFLAVKKSRLLKKKGLYSHILEIVKRYGYENLNPMLREYLSTKEYDDTKDDKTFALLKKCMLLIIDISEPSVDFGTMIEFAVNNSIPVLCLCDQTEQDDIPRLIRNYKSSLFTLLVYSKESITDDLSKYFNTFKRNKVKFNAFIDPEIDNYMKWYSQKQNISKSDFFRQLVIDKLHKDKEYKALNQN